MYFRIDYREPTTEKPQGYLGAIAIFNDGRGRDLHDGPATENTLDRIRNDVLAVMEGFRNSTERDIDPEPGA